MSVVELYAQTLPRSYPAVSPSALKLVPPDMWQRISLDEPSM